MSFLSLLSTGLYLVAAMGFVYGLKMLSKPTTARRGNLLSAAAMLAAVVGAFVQVAAAGALTPTNLVWIAIGLLIGTAVGVPAARLVKMTAMPEMVALFNGFGGMASLLIAAATVASGGTPLPAAEMVDLGFAEPAALAGAEGEAVIPAAAAELASSGISSFMAVTLALAAIIGGVTFTGSLVAFGKLSEKLPGKPMKFPYQHLANAGALAVLVLLTVAYGVWPEQWWLFLLISLISLGYLGGALVLPIGGADMPVVISLLNSYSGLAACAAGFAINSPLLIITGALVGASGLILTRVMCLAMNRSLANVLFSGFGSGTAAAAGELGEKRDARVIGSEEAYYQLEAAQSVVFVPGYGMAVAQAQHAVRELATLMEKNGTEVRYAIHPVAGRMPGHMSVLLAEANVPYDELVDMADINPRMETVDVAVVIGANDTVNPDARDNPSSALAGMPIIEVDRARSVFVLKRSLGAGYAGVENPLFFKENTSMVLGDAKKTLESIIAEFKEET